jgi:ribosomal protein S18 acetylase RimI-like enzyme
MNGIVLDPSPPNLVKALEANLHAHIPQFGYMPHTMVWQESGFLAVRTSLDSSECHVYLAHFEPEEAETKIKQVLEWYCAQNCLPMYWQVGPSTLPADLGKYLLAQGFSFFVRTPGMAVELQGLEELPAGLGNFVLSPVRTGNQLEQWVNILAKVDGFSDALRDGFYRMFEGLSLSPGGESQLFLGMENGKAVATSRLFCEGEVAGIWHVATLPEARGKGYGTAMTLAAAQAGRERGRRFGILYSTPAGFGVYNRLGF